MEQFWKAYDGKEFSDEAKCREYEIGTDTPPTTGNLKLWTKDRDPLWDENSEGKEIDIDRFNEAKYAEFIDDTGIKVFKRLYYIQNRIFAPTFLVGNKAYYDIVANEWVNFNILAEQFDNATDIFPHTKADDE